MVSEVLLPPKVPLTAPSSCTWSMGRPFVGRFHDQVAPVAPLRLPLKPVGVSVSP